ncbi:MAG: sensor histidine kinase, partial [Pricia sp.]
SQGYLMGLLIGTLAFLLFIGYLFYRNKLRKARKKERVQEAEVQLLKQEQQNQIFSAMIEGQEKESKRLAIDLHDGLGGRLSGISLNLSKLDKDEPKKYPKQQLQKVMKDLDDSLSELRSIARNMMPETLVKFGLEAALKDYCSSMNGSDTKVTLQFYGSDRGIDLNQQVTMYRVIHELINNAIKHAKASEVLVQYMREGNQVDITVEDNGVGFKNEAIEDKSPGMGLSNLRTRVAYLKGDLDFQSHENEGTTVNVHLTVDHDQDHAA